MGNNEIALINRNRLGKQPYKKQATHCENKLGFFEVFLCIFLNGYRIPIDSVTPNSRL